MRTRLRLVAVAVLATTLAAGCSSSGGKKHEDARSADPSALAAQLNTALNALTSAHLAIAAGSLGGDSTADVLLSKGHATATDVHLTQAGEPIEVVTVDGKSYAKIAAAGGKPWVLVSADSSNAVAKSLATSLSVADVTTSLSVVSGLVASANGLQDKGTASVDGVTTTHYVMTIDPGKGTGSAQLDGLLKSLGGSQIPVDLWLDDQSRPIRFTISISLGSTKLPVTVDVSRFDARLKITAPPAAEVSSG